MWCGWSGRLRRGRGCCWWSITLRAVPGLEELLKAAARDAGRVRVLLLARHAGDWWQRLGAGSGTVRDLVADASRA